MPFVRRHVTRRLKAAKSDCDKELQRITNNITTFFEERLREGDFESERDRRERDHDSQAGDLDHIRDSFYHPSEFGTFQNDDYSSDGGFDLEPEYGRHSRQRAYPPETKSRPSLVLTHSHSFSGSLTESTSAQMSPASLLRQSITPWDRPLSSSVSSSVIGSSPASSTILLPEVPISRKQPNPPAPASWNSGSASSRRLSRAVHMAVRPSQSEQSSRSTSRSRSPLPPLSSHPSLSDYSTVNRRSSRLLVDDPVDPLMAALYEIITVATDIGETSVAQLTSQPKIMESTVQRVQNIGRIWDDHPDWHGRNWYVQVLLAIASLSRVLEWWEAEKQFWNFDDNEEEQDEPLMFVTKPAEDPLPSCIADSDVDGFKLNPEDDTRTHPPTPPTITRKSRDVPPSPSATPSKLAPPEVGPPLTLTSPSKIIQAAESARVLATERLRLQAETAQNQNIVMELSLDGDHFIWINHAWRVVVG